MKNTKISLILLCFVFIIILTGCSKDIGDNVSPDRGEEQYAIIKNYENGKEIKVTPNDKDYNDFVSIFSYEPLEDELSIVPKEAKLIKKITFYQTLLRGESISSKNHIESIMQLDIYYYNKDYYGTRYLTYSKEEKTYFKVPIKRINIMNLLEKRYS